jgi:hypothetical protein
MEVLPMIYVDEIQSARSGQEKPKACRYVRRWCRLLSDCGEIEELHAFAAVLGLRSSWFQPHPILPFYVLTPARRAAALLKGAQEMPLEMLEAGVEQVKLVAFGVDTLVLNVRYADEQFHATNEELPEELAAQLDAWQDSAKREEAPTATSLQYRGVAFVMYPHGAGKGQWRWLLASSLLNLCIGRGRLGGIVAQVRLSSEYLWSCADLAEAIVDTCVFLYDFFGEHIIFQVSEVHLCADVVGWDVSSCDWQRSFLSRARRRVDRAGVPISGSSDRVADMLEGGASVAVVSGRRLATLEFGAHGAPLSCSMYNKSLEIKQKSHKTWFYDLWRSHGGWDGTSEVWRVEFRFRREALRELQEQGVFCGVDDAYELPERLEALWIYAAGHLDGGVDGLHDGWLRYTLPSAADSNQARWAVHPAWRVVQSAFADSALELVPVTETDMETGEVLTVLEPVLMGEVIRMRKREVNIQHGVACIVGYLSTLAAWLGGSKSFGERADEADFLFILAWLRERTPCYLKSVDLKFAEAVYHKQILYGLQAVA